MDKIFKGITSITFNGYKINKEQLNALEKIYEEICSQNITNTEQTIGLNEVYYVQSN